jgi:hypothetical protein
MRFIYADKHNTTVQITLDAGETLADLTGPIEIVIPADPANQHYAALVIRARQMMAQAGGTG